jgi:hypothetical protein
MSLASEAPSPAPDDGVVASLQALTANARTAQRIRRMVELLPDRVRTALLR